MNMNRLFILPILASLTTAAHGDETTLTLEARQLVKTFASELKPRLVSALQSGGPAHAVKVCSQEAPDIAARLSADSGWQVKRVSLKPRNVASAEPSPFERKILEQFDSQLQNGTPVKDLYFAGFEQQRFYYLQPQPVEAVCLACHGANLAPDVTQALQQYAPGDRATGYTLGQIRGAFSVSTVMDGEDNQGNY